MPSPPRRVTGAFHRWDDVRTARCPTVEDGPETPTPSRTARPNANQHPQAPGCRTGARGNPPAPPIGQARRWKGRVLNNNNNQGSVLSPRRSLQRKPRLFEEKQQ